MGGGSPDGATPAIATAVGATARDRTGAASPSTLASDEGQAASLVRTDGGGDGLVIVDEGEPGQVNGINGERSGAIGEAGALGEGVRGRGRVRLGRIGIERGRRRGRVLEMEGPP